VKEVVDAINERGGNAIGLMGDVSNEQEAELCVQATIEDFGQLDILINNAGFFGRNDGNSRFPDRSI
jgi:NAD(P)-dependent dehydrogenase (short-subunit alcohol dehydrogenase family)